MSRGWQRQLGLKISYFEEIRMSKEWSQKISISNQLILQLLSSMTFENILTYMRDVKETSLFLYGNHLAKTNNLRFTTNLTKFGDQTSVGVSF